MTIECIDINWLCKQGKKVSSTQASISINSWAEMSETRFSQWVLLNSVLKYIDYPSVKATEESCRLNSLFKFSNVEKREIRNEIANLDVSKYCQNSFLKELLKRMLTSLQNLFICNSINKSKFPSFLRLADKIIVFKKDSKTSKHNYRTISIFKHFSELSAEVMF